MNKNLTKLMAIAQICMGLLACGDNGAKTFDTIYNMIDEAQRLYKNEGLQQVREYESDFWTKHPQKSLSFAVEVEDGIPLEIHEFWFEGTYSNILNNEIRIATIAKRTNDEAIGNISLIFYKEDTPIHATRLDSNPIGNGEIALWGNFIFDIKDGRIPSYEKNFNRIIVTRRIVEQWEVNKSKKQFVDETKTVVDGNHFILEKNKLGPIHKGQCVDSLPQSFEGLYDKYEQKKEVHEDDMDGEWVEEYIEFYKNGRVILTTGIDKGQISSFMLREGSDFITTPDGISVGFSAREFFEKFQLNWENYFEGTVFAKKGGYTYYINAEDLIQTDIPHKTDDFAPEAKVISIRY